MINEVSLLGRLGKDPEIRQTSNGTTVGSLWLATSETIKGKEQTEWHSIVVWNKTAENCKQYLRKGSLVFVKGRIASREYDAKDGTKRKQYEIIAHNVKFLSKPAATQQKEESDAIANMHSQEKDPSGYPYDDSFDDIPF